MKIQSFERFNTYPKENGRQRNNGIQENHETLNLIFKDERVEYGQTLQEEEPLLLSDGLNGNSSLSNAHQHFTSVVELVPPSSLSPSSSNPMDTGVRRCFPNRNCCPSIQFLMEKFFIFLQAIVDFIGSKIRISNSVKKSVAAFSLATLVTLIEPLNDRLGNTSYMVATAILFFHPARTLGSMIEAFICCVIGLSIGFFMTKMCLRVIEYYYEQDKKMIGAHIAGVILLWLTTLVTSFLRGRYSVKRPAISTATTMVHLLLFVTITQMANEDAFPLLPSKLDRITIALLSGTLISCLSCYFIKPQSAALLLREDISKVIGSIESFFEALLSSSILVSNQELSSEDPSKFDHPLPLISSAFTSSSSLVLHLEKMKREVQFEPWSTVFIHFQVFESITDCISRMVGGLSALNLATQSLCAQLESDVSFLHHNSNKLSFSPEETRTIISQELKVKQNNFIQGDNDRSNQTVLPETFNFTNRKPISSDKNRNTVSLKRIFEGLQPNCFQLVSAMRDILAILRPIFAISSIPMNELTEGLVKMEEKLATAKEEIQALRIQLINELFHHEQVHVLVQFVAALKNVGDELEELVKYVHELKIQVDIRRHAGRFRWLWSSIRRRGTLISNSVRRSTFFTSAIRSSFFQQQENKEHTGESDDMAPNQRVNQPQPPLWSKTHAWSAIRHLTKFECKFAFKTATTISLMAIPAFIENFQDNFYEYRLNWAMTTAIVVMTPSVGGSNMQGILRILGTFGGMIASVVVWLLSQGNPIHLFWMTNFVLAVPAFSLFLHGKYTKLGQIFLLTYSVIVLNKYAAPVDPVTGKDYSIISVALRRGTAVLLGVVIGLFVSWYIWPFKARKALTKGYADILMNIGKSYCQSLHNLCIPNSTDRHVTITSKFDLALAKLYIYADQTLLEPEWQGKFPYNAYIDLLNLTKNLIEYITLLKACLELTHPDYMFLLSPDYFIGSENAQLQMNERDREHPDTNRQGSLIQGSDQREPSPENLITGQAQHEDSSSWNVLTSYVECRQVLEEILLLFYILSKGQGEPYPFALPNLPHLHQNLIRQCSQNGSLHHQKVGITPLVENGDTRNRHLSKHSEFNLCRKDAIVHLRGMQGFVEDMERVTSKLVAVYGKFDLTDK